MKIRNGVAAFFLVLFGWGCATHQSHMREPIRLIRQGQVEEALRRLEPLAAQESKDQLVFLMEYGMALHIAGRYEESNKVLLLADKLTDQVDYHSVSRVSVAALSGEEAIQYKGESYEKLLINSYLALNFLMLGKYDSAMVEVRRINDKVKKFRMEGRKDYELNPFANYLSALIWEGDRKYDDAYIAFEKTYEIDPDIEALPEDLIRSAKMARRDEAYKKWKKKFPEVAEDPNWYDKKMGQVVVIFQQGWGPRKVFAAHDHRFPALVPEWSETRKARIKLTKPGDSKLVEALTRMAYNVERAAIKTLEGDYAAMVARKMAALAAKEVVADQIRQKDEFLGLVARLAMHVADRADLRQWASLPQTIQVARVTVPPGEYTLSIEGLGESLQPTMDVLPGRTIQVRSGKKTFVAWRSLR